MIPGTLVIGTDPGPTPGFCVLSILGAPGRRAAAIDHAEVFQCPADEACDRLDAILDDSSDLGFATVFQVERFVVGRRTTRSNDAKAGATTRNMVGELSAIYARRRPGSLIYELSASAVKPWSTDARLEAAGLKPLLRGLRHGKDGARHALYAAVGSATLSDPLGWKSL